MHTIRTLCFLLLLFAFPASAAIEVYEFDSEHQRERYQQFLDELRCPKCKNNNLAGTNSKIAVDLRRQLQEMIKDGQSDEQIIDYMVLRYGDFVLYRPRIQKSTMALWLGPLVFLFLGVLTVGVIVWRRRRLSGASETLTEQESEALDRMLSGQSRPDTHKDNPQ